MGVNSFVFLMFNDVPGENRTPDLLICSLLLSFVRLVSRSPIFRDACRRESRLLSNNQNATFLARFRCCTHYDFHVLPKSREAFDQFALGNSSKLTT